MADNYVANPGAGGNTFASNDLAGVAYPRVKISVGDAGSAADCGPTNPLPVTKIDTTASGTITTQNLVPAGTATAGSAVEIATTGKGTLGFQVEGAYTGALSVQGRINATGAWVTLVGATTLVNCATGAYTATVASAATGIFQCDAGGFTAMRVTGLAAMTGTATVTIRATDAVALTALDTPLPAGSAVIGAVTQSGTWNIGTVTTLSQFVAGAALANGAALPTTTKVGAAGLLYNSSTLDLQTGNYNTTTADTGTKTVSFNGATQTNFNARGAIITVIVGTVSGTTPTLSINLQYSPDAGTTWLNLTGGTTNVTATATTISLLVYPTTTSGFTPSATANMQVNGVLPRTWRIQYAISGTTPSFAITSVNLNYLL